MVTSLHVARSITACCSVEKLAFLESPLQTVHGPFDLCPPEEIVGKGEGGVLNCFFPLFFSPSLIKMYLAQEGSSDIRALNNAVMFCFF